jgi:hypothetical protein
MLISMDFLMSELLQDNGYRSGSSGTIHDLTSIKEGGETLPLLVELLNNKVSDANILSMLLDQRHGISVDMLEDAEQLLQAAKNERDKPIADAIGLFVAWDKKDLGFPFEPEAMDALQLLKEHAISDYERIKGEMRQAKVSLRELDKAINAHRQNKTINAIADGTHLRQSPKKLDTWPYTIENQAITWNKTTESGTIVSVELCNFTATIQRQIIHDDGAEERGAFDIAGKLRGGKYLSTINVPLVKFVGMSWITANWGNEPIVYAGQTVKDHLRCAIQKLSGNVERVTVYGHIGWKKIEGEWRYLHHAGALGAADNLDSISVDVDGGGAMHYMKLILLLPLKPVSDCWRLYRNSLKLVICCWQPRTARPPINAIGSIKLLIFPAKPVRVNRN